MSSKKAFILYYVYLLKSIPFPQKYYVGFSNEVSARLQVHNSGGSVHTSRYKPWQMVVYLSFEDKHKALAFERYLKSGSGKAFSRRHF